LDIKQTQHANRHHAQIPHRILLGNFMEASLLQAMPFD